MSERNYSGEIASMIGAFLKADNWNYDFDKETGNFRFGLNTSSKLKSIEYYIREKKDAYCVYAISPVGADVSNLEERAAMAEFLCSASYGMRYGHFEMDLQGGDYLISLGCTGYVGDEFKVYHRLYDLVGISVISDKNTVGFFDMNTEITVEKG